jgi:hypothetical protein
MADLTSMFNVPTGINRILGNPDNSQNQIPQQPQYQAQAQAQAQPSPTQAQPPTSGLTEQDQAWKQRHSGAGGVARSILGTLGDFLLTKLHMPALYGDSQKQHELNYAFDGAGGNSPDPAAQLNAARAVQQVDFKQGNALYDRIADNQRQAAMLASTTESRDARMAYMQNTIDDKYRNTGKAYLNSILSEPDDTKAAAMYSQARDNYIRGGLGKNPKGDWAGDLPETFNRDVLNQFVTGAIPVAKQVDQSLREEKQTTQADHFKATEGQAATNEAGRDSRFVAGENGKDSRTAQTIDGANTRNVNTVNGAAARNTASIKGAMDRTLLKPVPTPKKGDIVMIHGQKRTYDGS